MTLTVSCDPYCSSSRSSGPVQEYGRYKEIVEDADFEALDWKLRGCKVRIINVVTNSNHVITDQQITSQFIFSIIIEHLIVIEYFQSSQRTIISICVCV